MGPIWGRQDPGGTHVGPMNLTIWDLYDRNPPNAGPVYLGDPNIMNLTITMLADTLEFEGAGSPLVAVLTTRLDIYFNWLCLLIIWNMFPLITWHSSRWGMRSHETSRISTVEYNSGVTHDHDTVNGYDTPKWANQTIKNANLYAVQCYVIK